LQGFLFYLSIGIFKESIPTVLSFLSVSYRKIPAIPTGGDFIVAIFGGKDQTSLSFLARVLHQSCQLDILPVMDRTALGKPYFPAHPQLHFSISHSGEYILCALGSRPVGVDIECIRARGAKLARYALAASEYEQYLALGGDWPAFYSLWTKKEAWAKYTGEGLAKHFHAAPPKQGLYLSTYVGADFRAALCAEEPAPHEILWLTP